MKKATRLILIMLLTNMLTLVFSIQIVKTEDTTITVPDDYPTIQEAINAVSPGSTISQSKLEIIDIKTNVTQIFIGDKFCIRVLVKNTGDTPVYVIPYIFGKFSPDDAIEYIPGMIALNPNLYITLDNGQNEELLDAAYKAIKSGTILYNVTVYWGYKLDQKGFPIIDQATSKTFTFKSQEHSSDVSIISFWIIPDLRPLIVGDNFSYYITVKNNGAKPIDLLPVSYEIFYPNAFVSCVDDLRPLILVDDVVLDPGQVYSVGPFAVFKAMKPGEVMVTVRVYWQYLGEPYKTTVEETFTFTIQSPNILVKFRGIVDWVDASPVEPNKYPGDWGINVTEVLEGGDVLRPGVQAYIIYRPFVEGINIDAVEKGDNAEVYGVHTRQNYVELINKEHYLRKIEPVHYILHVQSQPVSGVLISYSGDYSGVGSTSFDVGPKEAPFTVTLNAPLVHEDHKFSYWLLDGVNMGKSNILTVKVDDYKRERTATAVYIKDVIKYTLHVKSEPIAGVSISYSGDYSGTGATNFDIGPKNSPFTVTLTAPLTYQDYTFDHWELDGIPIDGDNSLSVEVSPDKWNRVAVACYVREPSNINIYSEFAGFFFAGFNVKNTFFVNASDGGYVPTGVTGMLAGETLVFNYNNTIRMWTATFNMGRLKPGKNVLVVTVVYPNGEISAKSYSVNVLQVPKLLLDILSSGAVNVHRPLGPANFSISFIAKRTGYWNNEYQLIVNLNVSVDLVRTQVDAPCIGGEYASPSLEFNIEFTLSSSGEVSIGGELSVAKDASLVSVPISIQLSASAQGTFTVDFYEYSVELDDITVFISLSASGSYTLPTPIGISIQVGPYNINLGVTVELAAAIYGEVNFVFVPTDDRSRYFLGALPLALDDVEGFVGLPFILTGQIGAGGAQGGGRVGVWGWLQGASGFGVFVQSGSQLLKGYALVGAIRAGLTVKLIIREWSGCITLLSGSYTSGNLLDDDLEDLKGSVDDVATSRGYPPLGFDWINGSWTGIVAEDLPNGYSYTSINYEDKTYVYYTYKRPDGTAWISGYIFDTLNAYPAPIPEFSGVGVASPFLFKLDGMPVMLWAAAHTAGDPGNLTIILQSSQMRNGVWTNPVNVTDEGVVWAYTSDGEYIYAIWSPSITSNLYSNTILRVFRMNGSLLWERMLPGAMVLNGAINGKVIVGFTDGTYSIISAEETIDLGSVTEAGIIPETNLMYVYSDGTFRIFNQTRSIRIELNKAYAWPMVVNKKIIITTYTPGKMELYIWNGSANIIRLREYSVSNIPAVSASYAKGFLYLYPYSFRNESEGTLWCSIIPLVAPEPLLNVNLQEDQATVYWLIEDPEQYNITKIEFIVYHNNQAILTKNVGATGTEIIKLNQTGIYTFDIRVKTILDEKTSQKTIQINPKETNLVLYLLIICAVATVITIPIVILYQKRKRRT